MEIVVIVKAFHASQKCHQVNFLLNLQTMKQMFRDRPLKSKKLIVNSLVLRTHFLSWLGIHFLRLL